MEGGGWRAIEKCKMESEQCLSFTLGTSHLALGTWHFTLGTFLASPPRHLHRAADPHPLLRPLDDTHAPESVLARLGPKAGASQCGTMLRRRKSPTGANEHTPSGCPNLRFNHSASAEPSRDATGQLTRARTGQWARPTVRRHPPATTPRQSSATASRSDSCSARRAASGGPAHCHSTATSRTGGDSPGSRRR